MGFAEMKRKCKICKKPAVMNRNKYGIAHCLDPDCMVGVWGLIKQKDATVKAREYKEETKRLKERFQSAKPDCTKEWIKKVQKESFNPYIRERDKGKPCISCGEKKQLEAGHYRSVGACKELRFHPLNCHGQCMQCNRGPGNTKWSHTESLIADRYRANLIDRIGLEAVEWLEGPHEIPRYRVEDLKNIHWIYKQLLRIEKNDR